MAAAKPRPAAGREHLLYGSRNSGSAAVECALELAKLRYRTVDAATWRRKDDPQAFARLQKANPLHQVPTLVLPDGTVLTESAAILIHLALAHPRAGLLPAELWQLLLPASILTMLATPSLVAAAPGAGAAVARAFRRAPADEPSDDMPALSGHVIILGYGAAAERSYPSFTALIRK